mmetsp:Transcript_32500/g.52348  ORF Transcript_32500/g.52348 Transcript_32500/m.52348 type:complete len:166 (-) Transcript_32500:1813-2310(-)
MLKEPTNHSHIIVADAEYSKRVHDPSSIGKRLYSAKETYMLKEPTNHSHPIPFTHLAMRRTFVIMCVCIGEVFFSVHPSQSDSACLAHLGITLRSIAPPEMFVRSKAKLQSFTHSAQDLNILVCRQGGYCTRNVGIGTQGFDLAQHLKADGNTLADVTHFVLCQN